MFITSKCVYRIHIQDEDIILSGILSIISLGFGIDLKRSNTNVKNVHYKITNDRPTLDSAGSEALRSITGNGATWQKQICGIFGTDQR